MYFSIHDFAHDFTRKLSFFSACFKLSYIISKKQHYSFFIHVLFMLGSYTLVVVLGIWRKFLTDNLYLNFAGFLNVV